MFKKKLKTKNCICNKYGVNLLSFNILAPELLLEFWNKSYKLRIDKPKKIIEYLKIKNKNVQSLLEKYKTDIVCLQEVTVNVKDVDEYINNSTSEFYERYLNQYKLDFYNIANYSFKKKPLNYDFPDRKNISFEDKQFKCDSGILTLYNPDIIEHLGGFKSEDFPVDEEPYEMIINKPIYKQGTDVIKYEDKLKKYKSKKKCSFKPSLRCKEKLIERGSPFTFDKFKIKETGDVFYVINTHIVMNYPRIDSMKRMIQKIQKYRNENPNSELVKDFTWTQTIFVGDMNGDTSESNEAIITNLSRTRLKSLFNNSIPDRVFIGNKLIVKKKAKINIPFLKTSYLIENDEDILENQKLIDNKTILSDHYPLFVYFYKNNQ